MGEPSTTGHEDVSTTGEPCPDHGTDSRMHGSFPRALLHVVLALWIAGTALVFAIRWMADFYRANEASLGRIADWFSS